MSPDGSAGARGRTRLEVHTLETGALGTNCHILHAPERQEAVVVDPGDDGPEIIALLKRLGARTVAIWNTHAHFDHINANQPVKEFTGAPLLVHELEADWLQSAVLNLGAWAGLPFTPSTADRLLKGAESLEALGRIWEVHHVPGHSPGMCAFVCREEDLMVGGDLLFQGSVGRFDFPHSSEARMRESIRGLFLEWGVDSWRVLPGHGPDTTVGRERQRNVYVREFLAGA